MTAFRRILKRLPTHAAISVILTIVLLATMAPDSAPPVVAAAPAGFAAADEDASPPQDDAEELEKVTALVRPDQEADIESASGKVKLHVPEGAVDEEVDVEMTEHGRWGPRDGGMLNVVELHAFTREEVEGSEGPDLHSEVTRFNKKLTLSFQHSPEELRGLDLDTLKLYCLDEETRQWVPVPGCEFDRETLTLTATIEHFSLYGPYGDPVIFGPGRVMAFQTDLHSGAAVYSYPIEVPPGAGGFRPSVQLVYNSASVDEMKNKRDVGSWVGIGWSLSLGSISWEPFTDTYFLNFDQGSYELVQDSEGKYHTIPESFFKISKSGDIWYVRDREGTLYQFGYTAESRQYYTDTWGRKYYRWDLSKMTDTNGNVITVDYVQDIWYGGGISHIRSAYPTHVHYNNNHVDIQFVSSHDIESEYPPRRTDNPRYPVPKVIETRKLDRIEIKVDGCLVKKYVFAYNTTTDTDYDGDGTYYAGHHTLTSITEEEPAGGSLPPMSFTYSTLLHCFTDSRFGHFIGNPGNPALLYYPRLTSVNNGYGGSVEYSYSQMPSSAVEDVWTRQVVTSRTVYPGIGAGEAYQYTYFDGPFYWTGESEYGGWDDVYCGFGQARVTDGVGNYVDHYFHQWYNPHPAVYTGKEWATEWYSSTGQLLQETNYEWSHRYVGTGAVSPFAYLEEVTETMGSKTAQTRYGYDDKGNVINEYQDGDVDTSDDDVIIESVFYPNEASNILGRVAEERVYDGQIGHDYLAETTLYYYDGHNESLTTPPSKGNLTRVREYIDGGTSVNTYYTYDSWGNRVTETDANGGLWQITYEGNHVFPQTILSPDPDVWESYGFDPGTGNLLFRDGPNLGTGFIDWETTFGGTNHDHAYGMQGTSDGGYIIAGDTYDADNYDLWLIKTDSDGDQEWSRVFGGDGQDYASSVQQTSDGGYIIAGRTTSYGLGYYDAWLIKTDSLGVKQWDRTFGYTNYDSFGSVQQTSDGGYVVAGKTASSGAGNLDGWLIRTDANGTEEWSRTFGGSSGDGLYSVCETSDGGYVLAGQTMSYGAGSYDAWLIKTNSLGVKQWDRTFGDTGYEGFASVQQTSDGGYILVGTDSDGGWDDALLTKTDVEGIEEWRQTFGGVVSHDNANDVVQTFDGGYAVAGATCSYGAGHFDAWLIKTDANGDEEWSETFGGAGGDYARAIQQTSDGCYVLAGSTTSYGAGGSDIYSVKLSISVSTSYDYDAFGRLTKVVEAGDSPESPTVEYRYNNWGALYQQHIETLVKTGEGEYLWQRDYFDGMGRVIQTQASGEPGHTVIASTTTYNSRGLVEKEYVAQDLPSSQVDGYEPPDPGWKCASYVYDALGRTTSATAADGTTTSVDYSVPWQETVTNPRGYENRYYYDAFGQLTAVCEGVHVYGVYATTTYEYNTLGNLTQVVDDAGNTTTMGYDWLSRKTSMSDPDTGSWSYTYDANGNLGTQTDAKGQTIILSYDSLDRLTGKTYPNNPEMAEVVYTYDSTADGGYGKGRLTGMTDASGTTEYKYDYRGRLIEERRTVAGITYVTGYSYDSADRLISVIYPDGEVVTQTYDGRGLPDTVNGSAVGSLVSATDYNQLGQIKQIDLGNGTSTAFSYYGLDHSADYYGRLRQIKTTGPSGDIQDTTCEWDADGNLTLRYDALTGESETFQYDFLDRLTSAVSGSYAESYTYNEIGNITSMNGVSYVYGDQPHAVTSVGDTAYAYDANGNMTLRGDQNLVWDAENRLVNVSAEPESDWDKTFGGTSSDYAYFVQQTSDGGYIVAGYTSSYGAGSCDAWLIKTDSSGTKQWDSTFGGTSYDCAYSVQQTSDGGCILAGYTYSYGAGSYDAWLIKTDSSGIKQWDRTFGGTSYDYARSVQQISDGGYILAGYTASSGSGYQDAWLIKTDSSGIKQWDRTFGGTSYDYARSVQQTSDGGYIIAGYTQSSGAGGYDAWLIKTDSSGIKQWDRTFGGSSYDYAYSVQQTSDGGYIIGGYTRSSGNGYYDAWLIKTDSSGIKQWDRTFGGSSYDYAYSVQQTSDGGYIVAGYTLSSGAGSWDAWLIKTDSSGIKQWDRTFGGSSYDYAYSVQQTSDGGYIIGGYTNSYGAGGDDAWLLRLAPEDGGSYGPETAAGIWHMDEGAGTVVEDSSGHDNDGTIIGATWTTGKVGSALAFENNEYVVIEDDDTLNFGTGDFSVEFWMNYTGSLAEDKVYDIMGKTTRSTGTPGFLVWITTYGADGGNDYGILFSTTNGSWQSGNVEDVDKYLPNQWYHVVGVRSGTTWTIYCNGRYSTSGTKPGIGVDVDNDLDFIIGDGGWAGCGGMEGKLDEVRVYDRALSADEIELAYEAGLEGLHIATFVYDGDGNRVLKTEGSETTLYVNPYYEKNLTTGEVTTHYYLGGREIAYRNDSGLYYVHQDHLGSTVLVTDSNGNVVDDPTRYYPYGETRGGSGDPGTDKLFTGQRLDDSGLYYYNARYYDSSIGRFISADSIVPDAADPQNLNRYSYVLNNPLKYTDPSGHLFWFVVAIVLVVATTAYDVYEVATDPSPENLGFLALGLLDPSPVPWGAVKSAGKQAAKQIGKRSLREVEERALRGVVGEADNLARLGSRLDDPARAAFKTHTNHNFRDNLKRLSGVDPSDAHAHHVFPVQYADKFAAAGIDVHNPVFGSWWGASDHLSRARAYNDEWGIFFEESKTYAQIMDQGRKMSRDCGLTIYF